MEKEKKKISAADLMIGNNLLLFGRIITVCEISNSNVIYTSDVRIFSLNSCEPIPLTKENIIELGITNDGYRTENYYGIVINPGSMSFDVVFFWDEKQNCFQFKMETGGIPFIHNLYFVHEIQNLLKVLFDKQISFSK